VNLLLLLYLFLLLYLLLLLGLRAFLGRRRGRLVGPVLITDAITITVRLATLGLGPFLCADLVAAASLSASLREPVERQKNHRSGKKYAVFQ
jgi:hypothetical protein